MSVKKEARAITKTHRELPLKTCLTVCFNLSHNCGLRRGFAAAEIDKNVCSMETLSWWSFKQTRTMRHTMKAHSAFHEKRAYLEITGGELQVTVALPPKHFFRYESSIPSVSPLNQVFMAC